MASGAGERVFGPDPSRCRIFARLGDSARRIVMTKSCPTKMCNSPNSTCSTSSITGGAQHDKQRVTVALELRPLVPLAGILNGKRMKVELGGEHIQFCVGGAVHPEPGEPAVFLSRSERFRQTRRRCNANPVAVNSIINDRHMYKFR